MLQTRPRLFALCVALGLAGCAFRATPRTFLGGWTEAPLPFGDSVPHVTTPGGYYQLLLEGKWYGVGKTSAAPAPPLAWVRTGRNLLRLHRTLQAIGYARFVSGQEYRQPMSFDAFGDPHSHWHGQSLAQVVDSLILSGEAPPPAGYYAAFWRRREAEHNRPVLLRVLREIRAGYQGPPPAVAPPAPTDTLSLLLRYDLQLQASAGRPAAALVAEYFEALARLGLGHSAYNLVTDEYPGLVDSARVARRLGLRPVAEPEYWRTVKQGVWIKSYRSAGP